MTRLVESQLPFWRGQRVAAFTRDDGSGTTLGYYGSVVDIRRYNPLLPHEDPGAWLYSVFVPSLGRTIDLRADSLLSIESEGPTSAVELPTQRWDVRFDFNPEADNEEIRGEYSILGRSWSAFRFLKCLQIHPTYELIVPANPAARATPVLLYRVRSDEVLDRQFVLEKLAVLLGPQVR